MRGHHDVGGLDADPIDTAEHDPTITDRRVDAMMMMLTHPSRAYFRVDESRRVNEDTPAETYWGFLYYERWVNSLKTLMVEREAITDEEVALKVAAVRARLEADHAATAPGAAMIGQGDHVHAPGEHEAIEHTDRPPGDYEILAEALRELFIDKRIFTAEDVQREINDMETRTPALGAGLVARTWVVPDFRAEFLDDAKATAARQGVDMSASPPVLALENTPDLHHVVVCTLCSCYPRTLLGVPPAWYKSRAYRSRVVNDPRGVLEEFGTELPAHTEIRVVDSTADLRYIVIPVRPAGTEGWSAAQLAALVTRDSMVGVTPARPA